MVSINYLYRLPDSDEWSRITSLGEQYAASEAMEILNSDYDCLQANESRFLLIKHGDAGEEQLYSVFAEPTINYYAEKIDKLPCKWCQKDCAPMIKQGQERYDNRFCSQDCYQDWWKDCQRRIAEDDWD